MASEEGSQCASDSTAVRTHDRNVGSVLKISIVFKPVTKLLWAHLHLWHTAWQCSVYLKFSVWCRLFSLLCFCCNITWVNKRTPIITLYRKLLPCFMIKCLYIFWFVILYFYFLSCCNWITIIVNGVVNIQREPLWFSAVQWANTRWSWCKPNSST